MQNIIGPFEYVSILVSIILGLGITQLLTAFSEVIFHGGKLKWYWPHNIWILFILFLHVQDWFVTYSLRDKQSWTLPELIFVLLYPAVLFLAAKLVLPTQIHEGQRDMRGYYFSQFPILFLIISIAAALSFLFNVWLLEAVWWQQLHIILFMFICLYMWYKKPTWQLIHQLIAVIITASVVVAMWLEHKSWTLV